MKVSADKSSASKAVILGRIVNGQQATENQIPHQCAVLSPIGRAFAICGGSIISAAWVLTGRLPDYSKLILSLSILYLFLSRPLYRWIYSTYFTLRFNHLDYRWKCSNSLQFNQPPPI